MCKNALTSVKNFKMANMYTVSSVVERLDDFDFDLDDAISDEKESVATFPGLAWTVWRACSAVIATKQTMEDEDTRGDRYSPTL